MHRTHTRLMTMIGSMIVALLLAAGCSDDDNGTKTDGAVADAVVTDMADKDTAATDGATADLPADEAGVEVDGTNADTGTNPYNTSTAINAFLEGKTLIMEGENIPPYPNGYDENINFGSATQCYSKVTMTIQSGTYTVVSELGTLENAPNQGDVGTCDHDTKSGEVTFTSTVAKVENVAADGSCFDFDVTYTGFAQEGRGQIAADGSTVTLELYFKDQAVGHRCADGAVGASGVTVNGVALTGDAKQVYEVQ